MSIRQPAIFIPHGGGPCFWMPPPPSFGPHAYDKLRDYLGHLVATLPQRPRAFLVISAHWEERVPTVSTCTAPPMLFDYYGFPDHTYQLSYPAPGAPDVAGEVRAALNAAGIPCQTNDHRGFDHGVFVPFLIIDPQANIPVVMLSLQAGLDPAFHIALGQALQPLRDQGVAIVGSGMSYHNLRQFRGGEGDGLASQQFDQWLAAAATAPDSEKRNALLVDWEHAPGARACHPREEHLLPLMVVAGAAGDDVGVHSFSDNLGNKAISGFGFGAIKD